MYSELSILALYGLLIIVTIVAQVTLALPQFGIDYLNSPRDEGRKLTGVAGRLERAATNMIIGLVFLTPAILILKATDSLTATSLLAAQTVLAARLAYVLLYAAGVPWLRTAVWLVSIAATAYLYLLAL